MTQEPKSHHQASKNDDQQKLTVLASLKEHSQSENPSELKFSTKPSLAYQIPPCINPKQTLKGSENNQNQILKTRQTALTIL
jgi:hypothetical protein